MIKTNVRKRYLSSITCIAENAILLRRRVEAEESIYMSVGGVFGLSRSFILTAIGAILTYDLLIISAFLNDKNKCTNVRKRYLSSITCIAANVILLLRRTETAESIYMSVGGLFRLPRTFILTAIGTILICDFLIISAFLDDKHKFT